MHAICCGHSIIDSKQNPVWETVIEAHNGEMFTSGVGFIWNANSKRSRITALGPHLAVVDHESDCKCT